MCWLCMQIAALCLMHEAVMASTPLKNPVAEKGVLDAREVDFSRQRVALSGTWQWQWGRLQKTLTAPAYVSYPATWNDCTWQGRPVSNQGAATYQLTILLPETHPELGLTLPDVYTAYVLFANGQEIARNGQPGLTAETTTPYWMTQVCRLPADRDSVVLVMQIANFHHIKGGPYDHIMLGDHGQLLFDWHRNQALDFLLTGCLFMGGLFFLGLYMLGRHERSILFFALFCVIYSYRIMGTNQYAFHGLFPELSWTTTLHLEYLSLYVGIGFFVLYTWELYGEDISRPAKNLMTGICFGFAFLSLLLPPLLITQLMEWFLYMMFGFILYGMWVYIQAARNRRPGAEYALMSTGVLLVIFLFVLLNHFGIFIPQKWVLFFGYLLFFFLQSLILSYRFAYRLQLAKHQAEEGLRVKSEFLSTMSHEIRTPLNAVVGMTHLLIQNNPREDQVPQLEAMQFSTNNLLEIVNDILDFNKIEAGKVTFESIPTDIARIVQQIQAGYRINAEKKGIELRIDLDPAIPRTVLADPTRTTQVLMNLVQNGIKFTDKGWVDIRVKLSRQEGDRVDLTFSVKDTGIGVAPDKQKLIFNDFTQADSSMSRNYGGTGLGLSICKRILDLQGVELKLASEPDKGSMFYFTQTFMKAEDEPAPVEPPKPVPKNEKPLEGICVLLVEDNPMNVFLAESILTRLGATAEVAENGQIALDKLDTARHHIVLMDLQMPVMDGYEATKQIRARGETLPIIALTASLPEEVEEKIRTTGLNDMLVKPFYPDDLVQVVLKYVKTP
nr:response regulator [uncultured Arsenicibacter sp.]